MNLILRIENNNMYSLTSKPNIYTFKRHFGHVGHIKQMFSIMNIY